MVYHIDTSGMLTINLHSAPCRIYREKMMYHVDTSGMLTPVGYKCEAVFGRQDF